MSDKPIIINTILKKALFADNDSVSYILASELLRSCNFEVTHARCGLEALSVFRQYPFFDLVITELRLPKINGFSVLKEIRDINTSLPVIAQTAQVNELMYQNCLNAGFNGYIEKPFNLDNFIGIVNSMF